MLAGTEVVGRAEGDQEGKRKGVMVSASHLDCRREALVIFILVSWQALV